MDEMKVNVDLVGNGSSTGQVANQLQANGRLDLGRLRPWIGNDGRVYVNIYKGGNPKLPTSYQMMSINTNGTLRRDEWKTLDEAILEVSRQRLGGVEDLIANNLTYNLGNAMGTTVLEWHDVSEALTARLTMDGVTRGNNDQLNFQTNYLPIPIIHVDYEINARMLAASRNLGNPLDTTLAERAARKVNEKLEAMLFTDTTYAFGTKDDRDRNKIYSYLNHPDRNIVSIGTHWDDLDYDSASASGGDTIINKVVSLKQASINAYHYGPWMLYIPTAYETVLDKDYSKETPTTIRERILKISGIKGIKVIDTLPVNNVLLVQMTSDVVRLVRGMGISNVQWQEEGQFITKYKVMTIQVPQIRSDQNGKSGIVHMA
jgi:hypothetical protein